MISHLNLSFGHYVDIKSFLDNLISEKKYVYSRNNLVSQFRDRVQKFFCTYTVLNELIKLGKIYISYEDAEKIKSNLEYIFIKKINKQKSITILLSKDVEELKTIFKAQKINASEVFYRAFKENSKGEWLVDEYDFFDFYFDFKYLIEKKEVRFFKINFFTKEELERIEFDKLLINKGNQKNIKI